MPKEVIFMSDKPLWKKNKIKYDNEYVRTHYKRVIINYPIDEYQQLEQAVKESGLSRNQYILNCIQEHLSQK